MHFNYITFIYPASYGEEVLVDSCLSQVFFLIVFVDKKTKISTQMSYLFKCEAPLEAAV